MQFFELFYLKPGLQIFLQKYGSLTCGRSSFLGNLFRISAFFVKKIPKTLVNDGNRL